VGFTQVTSYALSRLGQGGPTRHPTRININIHNRIHTISISISTPRSRSSRPPLPLVRLDAAPHRRTLPPSWRCLRQRGSAVRLPMFFCWTGHYCHGGARESRRLCGGVGSVRPLPMPTSPLWPLLVQMQCRAMKLRASYGPKLQVRSDEGQATRGARYLNRYILIQMYIGTICQYPGARNRSAHPVHTFTT
jgi:hypothetical protein